MAEWFDLNYWIIGAELNPDQALTIRMEKWSKIGSLREALIEKHTHLLHPTVDIPHIYSYFIGIDDFPNFEERLNGFTTQDLLPLNGARNVANVF